MPRRVFVVLALILTTGCEPQAPAPASAPADTLVAVPPPPAERGTCVLTATDTVAIYNRPSVDAGRFGTLAAGDEQRLGARSGAWLGFDPATAQAANVGPFRLRWVQADGPFRLEGNCDGLDAVGPLPPHTCFMMAMGAVSVYAQPDTASALVATLPSEGYAPVAERTGAGWARVTLTDDRSGWIAPEDGNFNGDCDLSR